MKTRFSKPAWFLCVLSLAVWAVAPGAAAQRPPALGLQFSAGQLTLSLTGTGGAVYSIQSANDLTPTNRWVHRTLLQVQAGGNGWIDPSAAPTGQRFYRAVLVAAPADPNLVFIQPGTFIMGSPTSEALRVLDESQHGVMLSRGFWMESHLVTQGDYLSVVGTNPSYFTPANGYSQDLTRPVEMVNWFDATNYCARRTQQERAAGLIPTNYVYRLPTESEWEYACRAGTTTAFYLGSDLASGQANFDGLYEYDAAMGTIYNPSGIALNETTPVDSYAPNGWGLYDMTGNVWEWCQDLYGTYPAGSVTDPQGAVTGANRVLRGGSWFNLAQSCRSAQRINYYPTSKLNLVGFRVVLAPAQP